MSSQSGAQTGTPEDLKGQRNRGFRLITSQSTSGSKSLYAFADFSDIGNNTTRRRKTERLIADLTQQTSIQSH